MPACLRCLAPALIMLAGCATPPSSGTTGSTQGATLVRRGEVTSVNVLDPRQGPSQRHTETRRVTVRFENGDERAYTIEGGDAMRIGDAVQVTSSQGATRITR